MPEVTSIRSAELKRRTGFSRGDVVETPDGPGTIVTAVITKGVRHYWATVDGEDKRYTAAELPDPSEES